MTLFPGDHFMGVKYDYRKISASGPFLRFVHYHSMAVLVHRGVFESYYARQQSFVNHIEPAWAPGFNGTDDNSLCNDAPRPGITQ